LVWSGLGAGALGGGYSLLPSNRSWQEKRMTEASLGDRLKYEASKQQVRAHYYRQARTAAQA